MYKKTSQIRASPPLSRRAFCSTLQEKFPIAPKSLNAKNKDDDRLCCNLRGNILLVEGLDAGEAIGGKFEISFCELSQRDVTVSMM